MTITKIISKATCKASFGNIIPEEQLEGSYDILCNDAEYVYIRANGDHREIPFVEKFHKTKWRFFDNEKEIKFDEFGQV